MNYNENIGIIIMQARKKMNMSQNALAKKLFVTRQAVSNWELGKSYPDVSVVFKLCKILNIDIKKIIELDGNLKVENIIEVEKRKTNRRNLIFIVLIIIIFLAIIATIIIVLNRNAFVLYNVYLDSDEFELNNAIIVKSKIKNYFQFGTLISNINDTDDKTIYNIMLYKKNNDDDIKVILEQTYNDDIKIVEAYGYKEYFDDYNTSLDNLYLQISFIKDGVENKYDYKLQVEEVFRSNFLANKKDGKLKNMI